MAAFLLNWRNPTAGFAHAIHSQRVHLARAARHTEPAGCHHRLTAPALLSSGQGARLNAHATDLQSLLNNSRSLAMLEQQSVFVCGASLHQPMPCRRRNPATNLANGVTVSMLSWTRTVIRLRTPTIPSGCFKRPTASHHADLAGISRQNHIEFLAAGTTNWQNGRFTFCSKDTESEGLEVVLNVAGRSYIRSLTTACESENHSREQSGLGCRVLSQGASTLRMDTSKVMSLPLSG